MVSNCRFVADGNCVHCQDCGFSLCNVKLPVHRACPATSSPDASATSDPIPTRGPGTELKRLLSRLDIVATGGCPCNEHAAQMDAWGCDECEKRLDEIVGWLQEEHRKRAAAGETILPWSKLLATNIVKLAIRRARRKESQGPN